MSLPVHKTQINGMTYSVAQLPYSRGKKILVLLYKTLGPALADALSKAPDISGDAEVSLGNFTELAPAIAAVVRTLADNLSENDFDQVVGTMAEFTNLIGPNGELTPLTNAMEFHFGGNYSALFKWLGFCLKINYADFFSEQGPLATLLAKAKAARVSRESQSPSGSTGLSTESPQASGTQAD